jgi:hypothetical protein
MSRCSCFLEEPDDGHNRPKLVAQNLQIKRRKTELAVTDFVGDLKHTSKGMVNIKFINASQSYIHRFKNLKKKLNNVSMFMFLVEPDDGHNTPKLVAQNLQIKRRKQSWV